MRLMKIMVARNQINKPQVDKKACLITSQNMRVIRKMNSLNTKIEIRSLIRIRIKLKMTLKMISQTTTLRIKMILKLIFTAIKKKPNQMEAKRL